MRVLGSIATAVLVVLYPIAIWIGLTYLSARTLGLWIVALLVPLVLLRFRRASREDLGAALRVPLAILAVVALSIVFDDPRFVLAMPVLINLVLLATFASSLFGERTIIERFARMQEARLAHIEGRTRAARAQPEADPSLRDGVGPEGAEHRRDWIREGSPIGIHSRRGIETPLQPTVQLSAAQVAHCRQVTWVWCGFFVVNAAIAGLLAIAAPLSWWAAYTSGIAYALMGALFTAEYLVRQYRFRRYGTGLHDRLLSRILPPREPPR